jgi:hypothetical protein
MISLKIAFGNTFRRTQLDVSGPDAFKRLNVLTCSLFPQLLKFQLKFTDDENELCTISSDVELAEAISVVTREARPILKIFVANAVTAQECPLDAKVEEEPDLVAPRLKPLETHVGIWCDECRAQPIIGPRFKCMTCKDYDLCLSCMDKKLHTNKGHEFERQPVNKTANVGHKAADPTPVSPRMESKALPVKPSPVSVPPPSKRVFLDEPVHEGISCDQCHQCPIQGTRFKCTVCDDFDLCSACETKGDHPIDHPMLQYRVAQRFDIHYNVRCDDCQVQPITGPRYQCTVCRNYDLCEVCESKNEHPADHPLLKLCLSHSVAGNHGFKWNGRRFGGHGHGRHGQRFGGHGHGRVGGHGHGLHGESGDGYCNFAATAPPPVSQVRKLVEQNESPIAAPASVNHIPHLVEQHVEVDFATVVDNKDEYPVTERLYPQLAVAAPSAEASASVVPLEPLSVQSEPVEDDDMYGMVDVLPPFAAQLAAMQNMGFSNAASNQQVLEHFQGDLNRAVNYLVNDRPIPVPATQADACHLM